MFSIGASFAKIIYLIQTPSYLNEVYVRQTQIAKQIK
jgi:hypothetical protein